VDWKDHLDVLKEYNWIWKDIKGLGLPFSVRADVRCIFFELGFFRFGSFSSLSSWKASARSIFRVSGRASWQQYKGY